LGRVPGRLVDGPLAVWPLHARQFRVGSDEGVAHLAAVAPQTPLELPNPQGDVTRHALRPPSPPAECRRGGSSLPGGTSASYSAFTGIIVPFEAGVFGSVTTSSPFLNVAVTLLPSTAIGSRTLRRNAP
jgi:hypothetical protein